MPKSGLSTAVSVKLTSMTRLATATCVLCLLVLVHAGCAPKSSAPSGVAWQNSTIDALLDGNYDGDVTFGELCKHGDFGLGTLNALDGEMLAIGGRFYQVRSDGHVYPVPSAQTTPFAAVTFFHSETTRDVRGPMPYAGLQDVLDDMRETMGGNDGRAYAFMIRGSFD